MSRLVILFVALGMSLVSLCLAQTPAPIKTVEQPKKLMSPPDSYKYAGLPPKTAAEVMTVPDGFTVKLFAGEPDVQQPIAFCIDDRGRLWVAEAYSYPVRRADKDARDRILIFEDTDGDGVFDKKTVFMEGLNLVSGIEVGFGGVWIGAAPYLMYVPIKAGEGEDKPAGKPQILLDGWGYQDTHETLNTFTWGPDGWLYGCHGVFTHSRVGKPSTPDKDRVPLNAAVWRYHPTRHLFEVFAHGTSNPWGLDFDEHGQLFVEACVIPHNWHIIQGARYQRQGGQHFNPYTYADILTIAEHRHYLGAIPHDGNGRSDSAGGGHAHSGAMIYQGGSWPKEYHGKMFMGNIHGHRLNVDVLTPKGSGFVASRHPDFLLSHDKWALFVNLQSGPDGNVYVIDWYDKQTCHTGNPQVWDRSNGRIYKIVHKDAKPVVGLDLAKLSNKELVNLQMHDNVWYARHARRILQERAAAGTFNRGDSKENIEVLRSLFTIYQHPDPRVRLRALWTGHVLKSSTEQAFGTQDKDEHVRAWAVQLATEWRSAGDPGGNTNAKRQGKGPASLTTFEEMAKTDASPVVRLYLASALQRLPVKDRWGILQSLLAHGEDGSDHNLPLMYWYAAEPLAEKEPARALDLALASKVPPLPQFMTRRVSAAATPEALALVVERLAGARDDGLRLAMLRGLQDGLKGRRDVAIPAGWPNAFAKLADSKNADVRNIATSVAVTFGDPTALAVLRDVLVSTKTATPTRQEALASLLAARDKQLPPILHQLLSDLALRSAALKGLAVFDDPRTPELILGVYASLDTPQKRDALNTLASRAPYGKALLEAIADKKIPANEVPADVIRQLRNLKDLTIEKRIGEVWGIVRATPADKTKLIAEWRKYLSAQVKTDVSVGRAVYAKTCQQCHTLFGTGGQVGPDITGANRGNLDYLLENILDPSAVIPKEYASTVIELKAGRVVTGIIRGETQAALSVATANETLTISRDDILAIKASDVSMMPDDLLKPLTRDEVRALVAYLQSPKQVPIQATPENAKDFFNGKDLTGWDGDPKLWTVENGEIVGKSPGLKRNMWLVSHMTANDFKLTFKVKLVPNSGNSGVQFHSEVLPTGAMRGPQADIGVGYWGTLYEEEARGSLWKEIGDKHVKVNDWNDYVVEATGSKVRTWLNGKLCVDLDDPKLSRRGVFALQLHSGGAMEVRFKDVRLEIPK